jgi:DNA polymerase III, delta subunit
MDMQHHAYIYEGSQDLLEPLVADAKKEFNFEGDHNPDLHVLQFEKFLIEDAHELTRKAQLKSVSGRSLFVLGLASINTHAQQALLKLFEEPQQGITFVLLVPHGTLMPTLRSRLMQYPETHLPVGQKVLGSPVLGLTHRGPDHFARQAAEFLKASYKTRSGQIADLLKDEKNTKERVRSLLRAIERAVYNKFEASKGDPALRIALEDISKVRGYLADQSPSLKMLLEHLAATLPTL